MKQSLAPESDEDIYLDPQELLHRSVQLPEIIVGGRAPTVNAMGYIFYELTPVAQQFISQEAKSNKSLFEVGCGFSNVSIAALKQGVGNYIASDLAEEHLAVLMCRMQKAFGNDLKKKLSSLKLLKAHAPEELPFYNREFDAIIIDKVLHFLTPKEFDDVVTWMRKSLKNSGKIYITINSINNKIYTDETRAIYHKRVKSGIEHHGYFSNIYDYINPEILKENANLFLPNSMLIFTITDLCKLFEAQGFKVSHKFLMQLVKNETPHWMEVPEGEEEFIGIIAEYSH